MNIKLKLREYLNESINKNIWYHGTPDVRELEKEGSFGERTTSVEYIKNIEQYESIMDQLTQLKTSGDENGYHKLLDTIPSIKDRFSFRTPIFLTNDYGVAKTYADPHRSFDYQNAVEKVLKVESEAGRNIRIIATGDRFRFIPLDMVRNGFVNGGISGEDFDKAVSMVNFALRDKTKIKTDMVASIGEWFKVDTIDFIGVLDSYNGGTVKSTVRMVFDPKSIRII